MRDPDKNIQQQKKRSEENVLPPTEIAKNPNPRANENIRERSAPDGQMEKKSHGAGSEVTDGEAG
jgi:hypothetical protein